MSCQSLSCDTDLHFQHRSVHFTSTLERKSTECTIDYRGKNAASVSGILNCTMSKSAPAACPMPIISDPRPLDSENTSSARFPRLEECAHFHYGRVQLGRLQVKPVENELLSAHQEQEDNAGWVTISVKPHCDNNDQMNNSDDNHDCFGQGSQYLNSSEWMVTRNAENFKMLDTMLHRCIYDRKVSGLPDLTVGINRECLEDRLSYISLISDYLHHFSIIADNTINCGPILNWFQMDNRGHKLLVASEDSTSINTPAVAAAYSVKRYVSQARDEISFEVGDMISVIDMPGPSESTWWRGKRGFRVGFFPQECVAVIGDKVPRNMRKPPPIVGSVAMAPIKPVLRKHGKLISLFRSFILNRPSRRSLRQQGILRERVFGCDLGEHLLNSGHDVPQVLSWCANLIEEHGCVDGIYRLSGGASATQKLRLAFDEERVPSNPPSPLDIHAVASLLKMYFRELPNPLCTYQLYSCFVSAVKSINDDGVETKKLDDSEKLLRMRKTVMKLPPPHYRTLAFLMKHLYKMSLLSNNTGMTARNMGIVWAPNLLRSPHQEFSLSGVAVQVVVTEYLICYAELIFADDQHLHNAIDNIDRCEVDNQISFPIRRPKSLQLATPTKLLSLEEARNKQQLQPCVTKELQYIEVGDGPSSLPRYHTVIQLPPGSRKRALKRSPSGWKGLFFRASKHRSLLSSAPTNIDKNIATNVKIPSISVNTQTIKKEQTLVLGEKMTVDNEESRSSRSYESLGSEGDSLPPLNAPPKSKSVTSGHNRSASCDSYFEASLAELAGMRLRLTSQEREMDIFSEDDTTKQGCNKDDSSEDTTAESSPIKSSNHSINKSPNINNKRTNLIDEDLLFIDCNTPEHNLTSRIRSHENSFKCHNMSTLSEEINRCDESNMKDMDYTECEMNSVPAFEVRIRDHNSVRRNLKADKSRHSHCDSSSSPKVDVTPQRHSTLIQIDWHDSNDIKLEIPNLCGYTQLQSDSETSLQTGVSKDSLIRRLIESKESISSHIDDLNTSNQSNFSTWADHKSSNMNFISCNPNNDVSERMVKSDYNSRSESKVTKNEDEKCTGIIVKCTSTDNLNCGTSTSPNNVSRLVTSVHGYVKTSDTKDAPLISDLCVANETSNEVFVPKNKHENEKCDISSYVLHNMCNLSHKETKISSESEGYCNINVASGDENLSSNMADSLEDSISPSNISYQNLNRLSMISGESGKTNVSKESSPMCSPHEQERTEDVYECFSFTRPSYIHLPSSSGGSTPTSPKNKSPLRATINITYKSPVKSNSPQNIESMQSFKSTDEARDRIYEDVGITENKNHFEASIQCNDDTVFSNIHRNKSAQVNETGQNMNSDADIYNKVKFFRQSIYEVNSLILDPVDCDEETKLLPSDTNLEKNTAQNIYNFVDENSTKNSHLQNPSNVYENVTYSDQDAKKHTYENIVVPKSKTSDNDKDSLKTQHVKTLKMYTDMCNKSNLTLKTVGDPNTYENLIVNKNGDVSQKTCDIDAFNLILQKNIECSESLPKINLSESDKENSDENENIASPNIENIKFKRHSVKQLTHKFQSPTEIKEPFFFDGSSKIHLCSLEENKNSSKNNETVSIIRDNVLPSTKSKNCLLRNVCNTRSLDENAFVKEFGNNILHKGHISDIEIRNDLVDHSQRNLNVLKSAKQSKKLPDLNLNMEFDKNMKSEFSLHLKNIDESDGSMNHANRCVSITPTTENKICLVQARISPKKNKSKQFVLSKHEVQSTPNLNNPLEEILPNDEKKDKLSRERIEKYKEERRMFLREKYSSQSFRGVHDSLKIKDEDVSYDNNHSQSLNKLERRNTADATQRSKFVVKLDSKSNDCEIKNNPKDIAKNYSSENDIYSLKKKTEIDNNELVIGKVQSALNSYNDQNSKLNVKEEKAKPHLLNLMMHDDSSGIELRAAPSNIPEKSTLSSDLEFNTSQFRKNKKSPSANIRDMAAIFESKSLNS